MTRIALLSSEPVRPLMAGIGIRYLEFARRLPAEGVEVVLVSPAAPAITSSGSAPASAPTSWRSRRGFWPSTPDG